jgi:hypothetical protein
LSEGDYYGVPALIVDQHAKFGTGDGCTLHVIFFFFKEDGTYVIANQTLIADKGSLKYSIEVLCPWNIQFPTLTSPNQLRGRRITLNYDMGIRATMQASNILNELVDIPEDEAGEIYRVITIPKPEREPDGATDRPYMYGCDWQLQDVNERPLAQDLSIRNLTVRLRCPFARQFDCD